MQHEPHRVCRRQAVRACCFADAHALAQAVARLLAEALASSSDTPAGVMLSGGSTPLAAYGLLAAAPPAVAPATRILFSDDRLVPPADARSNYGAMLPLLNALGLPEDRIVHVRGELPLDDAVSAYDRDLGRLVEAGGHIPLGLLGLGADGHTASLFTRAQVEQPRRTWATGVQRPDGLAGVSVTPAFLRRVDRLVFVVAGTAKRNMADLLIQSPARIAAGLAIAGHPAVEVWTDAEAWPFTADEEAEPT